MVGFLGRRKLDAGGFTMVRCPDVACYMLTDAGRCIGRRNVLISDVSGLVLLFEGRIPTLLELVPHHDQHGDLISCSVGMIKVDRIMEKHVCSAQLRIGRFHA